LQLPHSFYVQKYGFLGFHHGRFFQGERLAMHISSLCADLKFMSPATYQIIVKGFLDESWSDRLVGMAIDNKTFASGTPITALRGKVCDQAELFGVLNSIYEMHLPLISLELVKDE
jgi:hypothetical protein